MKTNLQVWGEEVLRAEKLEEWKFSWDKVGPIEGVTMFDSKTIILHGNIYPALVLHEIAHAKLGVGGHDSMFAHQFMRLVKRWMKPKHQIE